MKLKFQRKYASWLRIFWICYWLLKSDPSVVWLLFILKSLPIKLGKKRILQKVHQSCLEQPLESGGEPECKDLYPADKFDKRINSSYNCQGKDQSATAIYNPYIRFMLRISQMNHLPSVRCWACTVLVFVSLRKSLIFGNSSRQRNIWFFTCIVCGKRKNILKNQ